jgi:Protein of unknown function (DUF2815)
MLRALADSNVTYSPTKITESVVNQVALNDIRLARLSLAQRYIGEYGKVGKYHADVILPPHHPQIEAIETAIRAVAAKKWKEDAPAILAQIAPLNTKYCFKSGDLWRPNCPEYAGMVYINASNVEQPTIVVTENGVNIANRGTPVILTPSHPNYPYAGCRANVILSFFAYTMSGNGIGAQLMGVQFLRHDTRLA